MLNILQDFYRRGNWLEAVRGAPSGERKRALKLWLKTPLSQHAQAERDTLLANFPPRWANNVTETDLIKLRDSVSALPVLLDIAANDAEIKELADEMALRCRSLMADHAMPKLHQLNHAKDLAGGYGIKLDGDWGVEEVVLRLTCQSWWLRCLRVAHAKAREAAAIDAGLVGGGGDLYCSDDTLARRAQQLRRNAKLMADCKMQCVETGEVLSLADISSAGMANPGNRAAELITRTKGFEQLAIERGDDGAFITLTCPSRMHAKKHEGKPNKKYDGTKPDAANRYLVACWARARAKFARENLQVYGLRTVEPHHDGCPHWHVMLWFEKGRGKEVLAVLRDYFIADSQNEAGAKQHRVKWLALDASKGSAAAYVLKYIQKNLGGLQGEYADESDGDVSSVDAWRRVEAWATTWRIRQFQQIGGHAVSVWRELRRVSSEVADGVGGYLKKAWQAVQKTESHQASFYEYLKAQGGLRVKARESLVRLDVTKLITKGKYGETLKYVVKGVIERYGMQNLQSQRFQWVRV